MQIIHRQGKRTLYEKRRSVVNIFRLSKSISDEELKEFLSNKLKKTDELKVLIEKAWHKYTRAGKSNKKKKKQQKRFMKSLLDVRIPCKCGGVFELKKVRTTDYLKCNQCGKISMTANTAANAANRVKSI